METHAIKSAHKFLPIYCLPCIELVLDKFNSLACRSTSLVARGKPVKPSHDRCGERTVGSNTHSPTACDTGSLSLRSQITPAIPHPWESMVCESTPIFQSSDSSSLIFINTF